MRTSKGKAKASAVKNGIHRIYPRDIESFLDVAINAYPGMGIRSEDDRKRFHKNVLRREEDPRVSTWGLYRNGKLLGGLRLFDFVMNLFGTMVPVGGGGFLSVDLEHKKVHVARDLMTFFINRYRENGSPMAILYPFRPDFYRKMGFGYGVKFHEFRVRPHHLPDSPLRSQVRLLTKDNIQAVKRCHQRVAAATFGMIEEKHDVSWELMFDFPPNTKYACFVDGREVRGYLTFTFESAAPGDFLRNNIKVKRIVCNDPQALAGLLAFLRSQADQIDCIILDLPEENFHFLPLDPRSRDHMFAPVYHETNISGVGLMYKIIDLPAMFAVLADHSFGDQSCTVKLKIADSFTPANQRSYTVRFENGRPQLLPCGKADVAIAMDIAEFSSMLMGAISFRELYRYSLAEISDEAWVSRINRLFATESKPVCWTDF